MRIWVVDTSPLIFLAKLNRLDLLKKAGRVLVPMAVLREIQEYPDEAAAQIEEARHAWLEVQPVRDRGIVEVLTGDLDAGESELLALAREVGAQRVVIDDLDGRRFAYRLGLAPIGTLGLLLAARLRGDLPSLQQEIEHLQAAGFRMSGTLRLAFLKRAGE
jgi:hypothetical protein